MNITFATAVDELNFDQLSYCLTVLSAAGVVTPAQRRAISAKLLDKCPEA